MSPHSNENRCNHPILLCARKTSILRDSSLAKRGGRAMPRSFRTIQVSEVMVNSVVTVSSGDSLQHALSLLEKYQVHELPVLEQGRLIGIVTGGDLKFFTPAFPLLPDLEELRQTLR